MNCNELETYLRLKMVLDIIPVSRSTWYRGIKNGVYPKQVKLSHKVAAWKLSEIRQCLNRITGDEKAGTDGQPNHS